MATFSKTDLGTPPPLRWSSLEQLVMEGLTINGLEYLHVDAVTQPSLREKLKLHENDHALKVALDMLSCFVYMIL